MSVGGQEVEMEADRVITVFVNYAKLLSFLTRPLGSSATNLFFTSCLPSPA